MAIRNTISRRTWLAVCSAASGTAVLRQSSSVWSQDAANTSDPAETPPAAAARLSYDQPQVQKWRIGLILNTPVALANVFATFPIPRDWPEQTVTLSSQTIDNAVSKWELREVAEGAKQVALSMDQVAARSEVELTLDFAIERRRILPPTVTDDLVLPKRNDRDLRPYMGNSPQIDASSPRIKNVSRELAAHESDTPWQRVERIYDWVRENIKYVEGDLKNASAAIKDGQGDCEEMTSLVVALCRNAQVPARMVWVHEHCYPEFYLEDGEGNGFWFPCQAAGTRQFGQMQEYRPILQKGDRFKVQETKTPVRYVAEYFRCDKRGKGNPKPTFIRQPIDT
jgi:hypothetical protein